MKPLVPYYEKLGFVSKGPSEAQFGGGGWVDMVSFHPSPSSAVTLTPTDIRSQVHRGTSHVRLSSEGTRRQRRIIWMKSCSAGRHRMKGAPHCMHLLEKYHRPLGSSTILVCRHTVSAPPLRSRPARPPPRGTWASPSASTSSGPSSPSPWAPARTSPSSAPGP